MKFNIVFTKTIQLALAYLLILFIFMVFRFLPLLAINFGDSLATHPTELMLALVTGFKFDTIIVTYLFSILLLLLLPLLFTAKEKYIGFLNKMYTFYFITISFSVLLLVTVDFYYYKFFHSHFDDVVFGIVKDDTFAVLVSVWTDYPVIRILIGLAAAFWGIHLFFKNLMRKSYAFFAQNIWVKAAYILVFIGVYFLGMRGSLGTFPIGKDNMVVCNNNFINDITPNSVFYLKETIADRMKYQIDTSVSQVLSKYRYHSVQQAFAHYLGHPVPQKDMIGPLEMETDTSAFLEENPPNVVCILMESLGNHYLNLHSSTLNLLGELENQLPHCYVNRNFLSSRNGTIPSLESLVINTPSVPISQSKYKDASLRSSCALPFKKAGYTSLYITGGDLAWRNTGKYFSKQYFDAVEGRNDILLHVEGSSDGTWGAYDQFLFDRIYDKLAENHKKGEKSFVFALTTSNHTPFERPKSYQAFPVVLTKEVSEKIKTTEEIAKENFTSYQYANHYLGEFIKKIKNSELGKNTIIAVTGDHNNRQLFEYLDNMAFYHYSVPFILYVPDAYAKNKVFDPNRFGSHKDIFPTLYNLSLSGIKYLYSGNDLLTTDSETYFYGINDYNMGMDQSGITFYSSGLCYKWKNNTRQLEACKDKSKFDPLRNAVRSHSFLMDFYVRNAIKESSRKPKKQQSFSQKGINL